MPSPPNFASDDDFVARLGDLEFWWPYVDQILRRHGLIDEQATPAVGVNATYPTFVCGGVVVKLFGRAPSWRAAYAAERGAYHVLSRCPQLTAPTLLGSGRWCKDNAAPWPYLITSRIPGRPVGKADLSPMQWSRLAVEVGGQIRQVHAADPNSAVSASFWSGADLEGAATRSSLPAHLVAQVERYVGDPTPADPVFVHGDVVANHVYVYEGILTGIIDWGDAMVTDRHYEIIQIYRDLFACDSSLLQVFLAASDWPVAPDFARQALRWAFVRQAVGLVQHHTMDVFEPIAERFVLDDIATLDELADTLFGG